MAQLPLMQTFSCFMVVGAIATSIQYAVLIALVEIFGTDPVWASIAGYFLSAVVSYALNYRYSFRSTKKHVEAFPRFALVAGIGLVLNGLLMGMLVKGFGLAYLPAQIATTGLLLCWNFTANRVWSFAPTRSEGAGGQKTKSITPD